jgi:hypothetical protein
MGDSSRPSGPAQQLSIVAGTVVSGGEGRYADVLLRIAHP